MSTPSLEAHHQKWQALTNFPAWPYIEPWPADNAAALIDAWRSQQIPADAQ